MAEHHALLFTDIVESTSLAERLGDGGISALWQEHDRAARALLKRWNGREIDKSDGFLLLFSEAGDAVEFVLAYHAALGALSVPLEARAGMHVGPIRLRANSDEDVAAGAKPLEVDGSSKALAARVMAIARGGQTLLTLEASTAVRRPDLLLERKGTWRFKGIDLPVEILELRHRDARTADPAESEKAYRVSNRDGTWIPVRDIANSLPAERDAFIGREAVSRELGKHLDSGVRLISILGTGGIGKTRLVQHFGWTRLGEFAGGIWFCDLTLARSFNGIVRAVADGLGIRLGQADPITQLGNAICGRGRCLLILDNFEQVSAHAQETLGRWLDRAAEARFIVTSREMLGLPGETALTLDVLEEREGLDLFVSRARSIAPEFQLTTSEKPALQRLVRLLDCLPLAIELAAARIQVLPVPALLERMSDRFEVLVSRGGRRDRQATLQAAFDWSWDLLNGVERAALAQLSVFEGGCSLQAAEAVLDLGPAGARSTVVNALQSLSEKSLVRTGSTGRFSLLVSVRDYAAGHLRRASRDERDDSSAPDALLLRHCRFFSALGELGSVAEGCADMDNIIAACRWAVAHGETEMAVGALEGAWATLRLRGPFKVGLELALLASALAPQGAADSARIDRILGLALRATGRLAEARVRLEAALASSIAAERPDLECRIHSQLGELNLLSGRLPEAEAQLDKALEMARVSGDRTVECESLNAMGDLLETRGRLTDAYRYFEAAVATARAAGDRRREGGSLGNLGLLCADLGKMPDAHFYYEASLKIAREVGDRQWEGNTLCNLGLLHQVQGRFAESRDALELALTVANEMGYARLGAVVVCNLGLVHEEMLEPERARECYEQALLAARDIGDRRFEGQFLTHLGLLHSRQAQAEMALRCLEAAEGLLIEVSDALSLGVLHCARAEADKHAGRTEEARSRLDMAVKLAREVGAAPESELGLALARTRTLLEGAA